ncbi:MAG: acyl-CoA dehydratase activase-related protein [Paludibacteraceae bacterium]|nr:acyl-CoA dehydratase activase-related protein [Paludibacteraceae bacterium]
MQIKKINVGLDAGSTTLKIVATNEENEVLFTDYNRHNADIPKALADSLERLKAKIGADATVRFQATGSAGMGLCERLGLPFIQEVVAATEVVLKKYPETKTLVDIGGEDTKMIFFNHNMQADIRMNGNCAGGTGAFIDQMAMILGVSVAELSDMALRAKAIHPIASRCGVFSKTDIQNLIALNVCREEIAASIFNAVATQVLSTLSRGMDILPKVFLCGGPFAYIPALRKIFQKKMGMTDDDVIYSEYSNVIPALGASLAIKDDVEYKSLNDYITLLNNSDKSAIKIKRSGLQPLFASQKERDEWEKEKSQNKIENAAIADIKDDVCYIGIDSGSTTTKVVAMDEDEKIFFTFYKKSSGRPLETVCEGLQKLEAEAKSAGKNLVVKAACSTGYGEDLVKTAYGLDYGMVETIAHYTAAHKLNPNVSFILDIGGQDMKAIFVENGTINRLEINEACSSGCGSFIDSFAASLGYPIEQFVEKALQSTNPQDLGTRCTVFMNSKVRQCVREGATIEDISAGLAYSVVGNCLYKVLKLKDASELGDHIVLQGGTMRNKAVVRAFENSIKKTVTVSNYPELMGAYGAALYAKRMGADNRRELSTMAKTCEYTVEPFRCVGCENNCHVLKNIFANGKVFYSGNKCEKVYTNKGEDERVTGFNMSLYKSELAFKKNIRLAESHGHASEKPLTIGIPRVLGMFEDYQFWYTLFTLCGIKVVTSPRSSFKMYEKGLNTIMADNICFPAKLVHGHIFDLMEKKVDRIFYPYVIYEKRDGKNENNTFNCPIVAGYSDVIKSAIDPAEKSNIPVDSPIISFKDEKLLKKALKSYLKEILGKSFSEKTFKEAFVAAIDAKNTFENTLAEKAQQTLQKAKQNDRMVILLAGRPYHNDPLIQHKVSEIMTSFGIDVVTEDVARGVDDSNKETHIIPQWSYVNRIIRAARMVAESKDNIHFVQLTNFGCGPDAFILDEVGDILRRYGKNHTILKVDDVNNAGSLRLRIRSLVESIKFKRHTEATKKEFKTTPEFTVLDKNKKVLIPFFSEFHSPIIPPMFELMGYEVESLPPGTPESVKAGLQYANNEVCYPATLVVGDMIAALRSGKYDPNNIAFAVTQTGGQCRATNYIALIKKALLAAGYDNIPVVSISVMNTINEQSGFQPNIKKAIRPILHSVLFVEAIAKMYYATAVREKEEGKAKELKDKYMKKYVSISTSGDKKTILNLLREAANEFNAAASDKKVPRIGVVGEIFIKYNSFGNQHVVDWLVSEGIEPVIPSIIEFFSQYFPNAKFNRRNNLEKVSIWRRMINNVLEKKLVSLLNEFDKAASAFRYYEKSADINHEMENAAKIVCPAAQFGEGWLIPAEFVSFAQRGINAAVSLQPFGCIANHVISKGIERKVKKMYPDMNLLFLDFDGGVSEVNVLNRLHFLARQVKMAND